MAGSLGFTEPSTVACVDTATRVRDFQSAVTSNTAAFGVFFRAMLERGIYLPPSQFEAWFISGAHTARDIDRTVRAAREAMLIVSRTGSTLRGR